MNGKSGDAKGSKPKHDKGKNEEKKLKDEIKKIKLSLQKADEKNSSLEKELRSTMIRVISLENDFDYEKVRRLLPASMDENGLFAQENARLLGENKKLEKEKKRLEEELGRKPPSGVQKATYDSELVKNTKTSYHQGGMTPVEINTIQQSTDVLKAQHKDEIENMNRKLKSAQTKVSTIENEKTLLEEKNRELIKEITELKKYQSHDHDKRGTLSTSQRDDFGAEITKIREKLDASEKENGDLRKQLEGIEDQLKTSENEKEDLKKKFIENRQQSLKKDDKRKDDNSDFEGKKILLERNEDLERHLEQANEKIATKQSQVQTLEKEKDTLKKDIEKLKSTIEGLEKRRKNSSNSTIQELEEENDKLKTRLSQMAGAKLMTNNPNIADLSDTNRPTKLAEQYSEMYDNEWTNAFELLERNNRSETEITKTLYGILIEIFKFCFELSTNHANLLKDAVTSIAFIYENKYEVKHTDDNQIIPTKLRLLKDLRKAFAPDITDSVLEYYLEKLEPKHTDKKEMMEYLKKCVTLCWYMSVQDPPVIIDTHQHTGPFNGDIFRTYTKTGEKLAYVVWPPLYLHEGGPMLCKGVAQAK